VIIVDGPRGHLFYDPSTSPDVNAVPGLATLRGLIAHVGAGAPPASPRGRFRLDSGARVRCIRIGAVRSAGRLACATAAARHGCANPAQGLDLGATAT